MDPSSLTWPTTLEPVLETALDAVVVMTSAGLIAGWNAAAEKTFGWSRDEALGRNMAELIIPPRYHTAHETGLRRYLHTGEGPLLRRRIEVSAIARDGREFPVELSITPTGPAEDLFFLGFLRDISDRQLAQQLLERRARDAELLSRVTAAAGETASFEAGLQECLRTICNFTRWPLGHAFVVADDDPGALAPTMIWHPEGDDEFQPFRDATHRLRFTAGMGLPGRILQHGEPEWIARAGSDPAFLRAEIANQSGIWAAFGFPIKIGAEVVAVLEFFSQDEVEPDPDLMLTVRTMGEQVGRIFERRRAEDRLREEKRALEHEVAERRRAEEHQLLLLGELDHRVKNMLTVVTSIASQTARTSGSIEAFNSNFSQRLVALSRAHGLLTARHWETTPLASILEEVLAPHMARDDPRIAVSGPEVLLPPKAALSLSMVLHELITNAIKHGALSTPTGRIGVAWSIDTQPGCVRVRLRWSETGVPGVRPPVRRGFGTRLIDASVGSELGGSASAFYREDGLEQTIEFPMAWGGSDDTGA